MLLLIVYIGWQNQRAATQSVNEGALRLARLVAAEEQRLLQEARQLLSVLVLLPAVRTVNGPACNQIVTALVRESPVYTNIGATRVNGGPFCSALPLLGPAGGRELLAVSRRALETNATAISGYMLGRESGRPVIALASPWRDAADAMRGVVFLGLDLRWVRRVAAQVELPEHAALLIVDADGIALARYPEIGGVVGRSLKDTPLVREMQSRWSAGTIELPGLPDLRPGVPSIPRLWAFSPLRHDGTISGYVAIGFPRNAAFAPVRRTLAQAAFGSALIGTLTLVALWVGADRLIGRPVKTISNAAARLTAGDRTAWVGALPRSDELGQLARGFDQMADALEQRERELAEANRRATATRFAAILDAAPDGIVTVEDGSFRIIQFNKGAEQMFGYSAAEVLGEPLDLLLPTGLVGAGATTPEQAQRENGRRDWSGRRKGGEVFPLDVTVATVTVDGRPVLTAFLRDVTEHRLLLNALQALAESSSSTTDDTLFRVLVEHLAGALGVEFAFIGELPEDRADRVTTLAFFADGQIVPNITYDLEGTPSQTVLSQATACVYEHGVREHFPAAQWLATRGIEGYAGLALFGTGDQPIGLLTVMSRRPLNAGALAESTLRVFAVRAAGEIERRRADRVLQRSEAGAGALVAHAPFGIFRSREDGTLLAVNPALVAMLGYDSAEELLTRNLTTDVYTDPADRARILHLRHAGFTEEIDVEWKRKDGARIVVQLRGRTLDRAPAAGMEFEVFVEDVTA
jgi:PAS domain S-box-containing protein